MTLMPTAAKMGVARVWKGGTPSLFLSPSLSRSPYLSRFLCRSLDLSLYRPLYLSLSPHIFCVTIRWADARPITNHVKYGCFFTSPTDEAEAPYAFKKCNSGDLREKGTIETIGGALSLDAKDQLLSVWVSFSPASLLPLPLPAPTLCVRARVQEFVLKRTRNSSQRGRSCWRFSSSRNWDTSRRVSTQTQHTHKRSLTHALSSKTVFLFLCVCLCLSISLTHSLSLTLPLSSPPLSHMLSYAHTLSSTTDSTDCLPALSVLALILVLLALCIVLSPLIIFIYVTLKGTADSGLGTRISLVKLVDSIYGAVFVYLQVTK